ncbi:MAG: LysM peptidoglycan-binding domain-containing M23 family metallopeptidase [Candidatus Omnitrophota bacterium]|nr:LysM peptidoglycan-binding domain-containing M23 family metallopeptidase [Candidatus Omnitrophota bacterium]
MIDNSGQRTDDRITSINFLFSVFCFLFSVVLISGCAVKSSLPLVVAPPAQAGAIVHAVKKGETLWRISRLYAVDLEKIVAENKLTDTALIKPGQNILIPGIKKNISREYKESANFIWPVKGKIISYFKSENDHLINKGINIKARFGTSVLSCRAGVVSFVSDNMDGYGKIIIIDHNDGFATIYACNSQNLVKANDYITKGMVIAKVGTKLHFEIRKGYKPQNPLYYLP